ncbi:O53 family O-antigen flippase, partial [Escherichia coli]|nr:O53 family O-antigen flippase [Escherichia coli]
NQFIYQFGNYILPFLIIPFLINKLSIAVYKDFVVIQSLVLFFAVLINYGLDLFGVRYISNNVKHLRKCKSFLYISILSRLCIFIFCSFFLLVSLMALTKPDLLYWLLCFFWMLSFVFQSNWYLQGCGDFKLITFYGLLPKLIVYPFVFILVNNDNDAWVYLFLCAIANYASNILMMIHIRRKLNVVAFKRTNLLRNVWIFLVKGWYIFLSQASVTLISYANIFFLPLVLEPKSFVVFSTAERIVKVLSITTTPILNVIFPHISSLIENNKQRVFIMISRISLFSLIVFLLCYTLYVFIGYYLIQLIFPTISQELYSVLLLLLFNVFFVFQNNLFGTQIGLNYGKDKSFTKIIAINGILNIIAMPVFSKLYHLHGTILTSLCIQLSILICMYMLAKKCGYKFKV